MESSTQRFVLDFQTQAMNFNPAPPPPMDYEYVARKQMIGSWKKWFAWYPVKVHNEKMWLKTVYRRKINTYVDMDNWARYEYGTIFDVLTD